MTPSEKKTLKGGRADPESDSESESESYVSEEEYETISENDSEEDDEEDETSDSSYVPPSKKQNRVKKTKRTESYDEDVDDEEDIEESDEDGSEDSDDEMSAVDPHELRKTLAVLFPSNYINTKIKAGERLKEKVSVKSNKYVTRSNARRSGRGNKKTKHDSDDEEDEYDEDDEDDDDEEDEDDEETENNMKDYNIIFTAIGQQLERESEREAAAAIADDADEECNSEDEKTFMKETYETIPCPVEQKTTQKSKSKSKNYKNKHNKTVDSESSNVDDSLDVESEYKDLTELKKHLSEKLNKRPKSKILLKSLEECNTSIQKLVKKARMKNAKRYHKIISGGEELHTNELDYFKKKMSHKEQLRAIKELSAINEHIIIKKPYRIALLESDIPSKYKATVMQKLNMLRSMEPGDPEYYKLKTWVDTFMRVPFSINKNLSVNIGDGIDACSQFMENAKRILDDCVYGLNDAKMQIMQMVGQWIANPGALGSAIAIKGPPGTGKTSLVKEGISKILGREFAFIALGGTGDASFLEGHSYTYEGSIWGKIVQILIDSKCMNPVIYFDELDKVSDTPRGEEIIGVLTHLTDTTQNSQFHDKYFSEVDFDLSKCLFIFSYNDESKVNPILRDRMYRIQTKGYDAKEKAIIAKDFLLPKIREQVAFTESDIMIPDATLDYIISNKGLTKEEEGVRNLKRCLEIIHTKLNLFRLMKPDQNLFASEMDMEVSFPLTVTKRVVDGLIKNETTQNQSLLAMYV